MSTEWVSFRCLAEISAQFKAQSSPARKDTPTIAPACPSPPNSHHSSELPRQVSLGHSSSTYPTPAGRLEDFLESSTGLSLLSAGPDGPEPLSLIDLYSEMLSSSAILDHPSSPMDTSELHFAPEPTGGPSLDLAEATLDSMDWLELSGGPGMSLTPLSTVTPSLFSTDFLDGHDLPLHWDSCLQLSMSTEVMVRVGVGYGLKLKQKWLSTFKSPQFDLLF